MRSERVFKYGLYPNGGPGGSDGLRRVLFESIWGSFFVISGVFSKVSRTELKKMIEDNGGKASGSISSKTNYLVAGENMGPSKLQKAESLNVPIISEDDFLEMLEQ